MGKVFHVGWVDVMDFPPDDGPAVFEFQRRQGFLEITPSINGTVDTALDDRDEKRGDGRFPELEFGGAHEAVIAFFARG